MRILNIIASADPETGGPIEALRLTGLQMARLGHAVEVATLDKPSAPYVKEFPLPVHACGRWTRRYGYTPELARWIAANADRFDAAIIHGLWNHASVGGWSALRRAGLPYVVFAHGMMDSWFRETIRLSTSPSRRSGWSGRARSCAMPQPSFSPAKKSAAGHAAFFGVTVTWSVSSPSERPIRRQEWRASLPHSTSFCRN
jgi:hypothetical protein